MSLPTILDRKIHESNLRKLLGWVMGLLPSQEAHLEMRIGPILIEVTAEGEVVAWFSHLGVEPFDLIEALAQYLTNQVGREVRVRDGGLSL